jgi:glutathione S-transferase
MTMQRDLGNLDFCFGGSFTLADIAYGVALGYLDQALPKFDWRTSHSGLRRHAEWLASAESFRKTLPELA